MLGSEIELLMATDEFKVIYLEPQVQPQVQPQLRTVKCEWKANDDEHMITVKASGIADNFFFPKMIAILFGLITFVPIVLMTNCHGVQEHSLSSGGCYARINICPCCHYDIAVQFSDSQDTEG